MKENIINHLEIYFKEIQYADATFETYFLMKFGNEEWEKAFEVAPAFFSLTRKSMLNESLNTLCKLFEPKRRSDGNLNKLLDFLRANSTGYENINQTELLKSIEDFERQLLDRSHEINKILAFRDKLIAHYDNEYFEDIKLKDLKLSAEEIRGLIQLSSELVNSFYYTFTSSYIYPRYMNHNDVKQLMDKLLS